MVKSFYAYSSFEEPQILITIAIVASFVEKIAANTCRFDSSSGGNALGVTHS
jgi:hypothetical protein